MKRIVCVWMVMVLVVAGACAASGNAGLTVKAGTPGFGVDLTLGLGDEVNVRLSGQGFSYTCDDYEFDDEEVDDVVDKVEVSLDLLTLGAFLDWHPGGGGFRLSAGAFYNGNEASLSVTAGDTISINDVDYEVQRLDGLIEFNTFAPYIGIGVGNAAATDSQWHFALDLGILVQGSAEVSLTAMATDPLLQAALNADLAKEVKEVEDDLDPFIIYPILTLGLSYTF